MRVLGKLVKFFGNFIGVILSLVLSLALVVMLVATPMLAGFSTLTRPETIRQVVQEIDFSQFLLESMKGELEENEKKELQFLIELTETKAFDDMVELYATDLANVFEVETKPPVLTKEALRKIMNDNMEELIRIIRKLDEDMGEDTSSYTDAELEEEIRETFEEVVDRFLELAPTADDLRKLLVRLSEEITTDSSKDDERPNSGMQFGEDSFDTPSYEDDDYEGGGTITYIPGEGDTITSIIVGPDGTIQSGDGEFSYYVDPETGAIVLIGGEGDVQGSSAVITGGTMTFGKAVTFQNGTIRVLLMGISPSGGEEQDGEQEEVADIVLKIANMAKRGTLTLLLVGVITVLALLICLLRWPRFKGFMWVAIMLLIGAALVAMVGVAYTVLPKMLAGRVSGEMNALAAIDPIIKIIANSMFVAAAIYAGVAVVLIVLFTVFRKALRKQKVAKAAAAERAEVIEEVAEEVTQSIEEAYVEEPLEAEEIPMEKTQEPVQEEEIPPEEEISAE